MKKAPLILALILALVCILPASAAANSFLGDAMGVERSSLRGIVHMVPFSTWSHSWQKTM